MAATVTTTLSTSNMRSSSRQTRTNPTRTSRVVGSSLRQNSLMTNPPAAPAIANEQAGFYPAITHFTDSITALPRDYRRHTSLLKEVDAKAWHPEENLQKLLHACLAAQPTREEMQNTQRTAEDINTGIEGPAQSTTQGVMDNGSAHSLQSADPARFERTQLFASLRQNLMVMMITMDEKNHVINNANDELSRHLRRLQSSYPAIAEEVSEEARLGSLKHWAYFETNPMRRTGNHADRRQAAASLAVLRESEVAQRSEARRQALNEKKTAKNNQLDSDFDDPQLPAKKPQANGRNRRVGELAAENAGLGISGASTGKRKKTEKNASNGAAMERSTSATGGRAMSKEPAQQDGKKRKNAPTSNPTGPRKRLNVQDSPKLASSPLAGSFSKEVHKRSPAPAFARPVSSRARQNSVQNVESLQARPSSSTSRKNTANGNGVTAGTSDMNSVTVMTGKSAAEVKQTMKESINQKGERLIEEDGQDTTSSGMRGGILLQRSSSKQGGLKREANASEENLGKAASRIPPPLDTTALKNDRSNRNRPSKTSTPIIGSFADSPEPQDGVENGNSKPKRVSRPRMKDHGLHDSLSPKALPPKRSHKKGAGLLAQQQFQQRQAQQAADDAAHGGMAGGLDEMEDDEDGNGEGADEDERYCYCNDVSYGEMVACDNKNCAREWFHLRCVGLEKAPGKNAKWFCDECKELMKKVRVGSVSGNGSR